jgi:hypothetical protein
VMKYGRAAVNSTGTIHSRILLMFRLQVQTLITNTFHLK